MEIVVVGTGYVGLSNAVLLAQHNQVTAVDIVAEKVAMLQARKSPIKDADIEHYLQHKPLQLTATTDAPAAYAKADWVLIATPTDYDPETNYFNTSSVDAVLKDVLQHNNKCHIVIRSTIPVGYVAKMRDELGTDRVFLRRSFCARVKHYRTICIRRAS